MDNKTRGGGGGGGTVGTEKPGQRERHTGREVSEPPPPITLLVSDRRVLSEASLLISLLQSDLCVFAVNDTFVCSRLKWPVKLGCEGWGGGGAVVVVVMVWSLMS